MTRCCGNCAHSVPALGPDQKVDFNHRVCRIRAAQLHPMMTPNGPQTVPQWPVLGRDKGCSEHMTDEELEAMREHRLAMWKTGAKMAEALPGEMMPKLGKPS